MAAVSAEVEEKTPGIAIELAQLIEDLIGDLTAVPQPIEIKLTGATPAVFNDSAEKVAAAIKSTSGVTGVKSGVNLACDALDITIDPVEAGVDGVASDLVTQAVTTAQTGVVATRIVEGLKTVGIRVAASDLHSHGPRNLGEIPIRAPDGHMFPLSRVASIAPISGQPQISSENLQPMVAVTGRIESRGLGAVVADVKRTLKEPGLLLASAMSSVGSTSSSKWRSMRWRRLHRGAHRRIYPVAFSLRAILAIDHHFGLLPRIDHRSF